MNHNNSLDMILKPRIIDLVFKGGIILQAPLTKVVFLVLNIK